MTTSLTKPLYTARATATGGRAGGEVGDGHACRPPPGRLHLHPGGHAGEQAGRGHLGYRAHVMHGGPVRFPGRAGQAARGPGPAVARQARQEQIVGEPTQAARRALAV